MNKFLAVAILALATAALAVYAIATGDTHTEIAAGIAAGVNACIGYSIATADHE